MASRRVLFKAGPRGGLEAGEPWDDCGNGQIKLIFIGHGESINFIQAAYTDEDGELCLSEKHGGDGDNLDIIKLDYPDEIITAISGYYGRHRNVSANPIVIRSVTFVTRSSSGIKKAYGPYGRQEGNPFNYRMDNAWFSGLHGQSDGNYLLALGVYVDPIPGQEIKPALPIPSTESAARIPCPKIKPALPAKKPSSFYVYA